MLNFEYRVIPSTNGEEGGDEIYLGTPTNDNGALLWESPNGDGTVDGAAIFWRFSRKRPGPVTLRHRLHSAATKWAG